jgi:hypothetical protein
VLDRIVRRLLQVMTAPVATSLGQQALRGLLLLVVVGALMLLPIGLDATWIAAIVVIFLVLVVCGTGGFVAVVARIARRAADGREIAVLGVRVDAPELALRPARAAEAIGLVVRKLGVALPALVFFSFWALVYATLWLIDPGVCTPDPAVTCTHAFRGAGTDPTFGDFLYLSVNETFANPPPDFLPASQLARTAATLQVLSGILGVTVFAGAFFGVRGSEPVPVPEQQP